jgi:DNA-binding transcriptional LysR family regulator
LGDAVGDEALEPRLSIRGQAAEACNRPVSDDPPQGGAGASRSSEAPIGRWSRSGPTKAPRAAIHALETRLDTALFDRIGKRHELTEVGRVLLPEANMILSKVVGAEQALADLRGLLRGRLRLWASQTIGGYWLPPYLYRFHAAHPGVAIELQIAYSLQVSRAVLSGDADLGFVDGDVDEPVLVQVSVAVDQLVVVVAKSHELAMLKAVEFDDLRRASWVLHEKGAGTRQVFEKALRQSGVDPAQLNVVMELPSNETVRSVVEAGAGVTVLPRVVVADKLSAGTLVELPFQRVEQRYIAIRHGDRHRGRAESVLLDMMRPARSRKGDRGPAGPPGDPVNRRIAREPATPWIGIAFLNSC